MNSLTREIRDPPRDTHFRLSPPEQWESQLACMALIPACREGNKGIWRRFLHRERLEPGECTLNEHSTELSRIVTPLQQLWESWLVLLSRGNCSISLSCDPVIILYLTEWLAFLLWSSYLVKRLFKDSFFHIGCWGLLDMNLIQNFPNLTRCLQNPEKKSAPPHQGKQCCRFSEESSLHIQAGIERDTAW